MGTRGLIFPINERLKKEIEAIEAKKGKKKRKN